MLTKTLLDFKTDWILLYSVVAKIVGGCCYYRSLNKGSSFIACAETLLYLQFYC